LTLGSTDRIRLAVHVARRQIARLPGYGLCGISTGQSDARPECVRFGVPAPRKCPVGLGWRRLLVGNTHGSYCWSGISASHGLAALGLAVCAGRDETEARRPADAIGRDVVALRHDGLAGSPDEIVDKMGQYADVGPSRVYLQVLDLHDLDHLELIASEVMNQLS
jgi:hypothetical protein